MSEALEFDEMDFDEPMEVEHEEEKPAVKEESTLKEVTPEISVKAAPKIELQDPVLMWVCSPHVFTSLKQNKTQKLLK